MPLPGSPDLSRLIEDQRATNKPIEADNVMNAFIANLISTNEGWFKRQVMKYAAVLGLMIATWLVSHGVSLSDPSAITNCLGTIATGVLSLALGVVENRLSAKASPIASVPAEVRKALPL